MRIIGGAFRGRKLKSPTNNRIRPTTDRMRETLFNILSHNLPSLDGAVVLDAFAGTGALGLEALSRGAAHVSFFDRDPRALALVKQNVDLLSVAEKTMISCISSPKFPKSHQKYTHIFLDPPYNLDVLDETLEGLEAQGYLADCCLIYYERSSSNILSINDNFEICAERSYGDSQFTIFGR